MIRYIVLEPFSRSIESIIELAEIFLDENSDMIEIILQIGQISMVWVHLKHESSKKYE